MVGLRALIRGLGVGEEKAIKAKKRMSGYE